MTLLELDAAVAEVWRTMGGPGEQPGDPDRYAALCAEKRRRKLALIGVLRGQGDIGEALAYLLSKDGPG